MSCKDVFNIVWSHCLMFVRSMKRHSCLLNRQPDRHLPTYSPISRMSRAYRASHESAGNVASRSSFDCFDHRISKESSLNAQCAGPVEEGSSFQRRLWYLHRHWVSRGVWLVALPQPGRNGYPHASCASPSQRQKRCQHFDSHSAQVDPLLI
jgi:hypothetical protein